MPTRAFPANPPDTGHVVCRDGYFWTSTRTCLHVRTSLSMEEVEACFEGRAMKRAEAMSRLTIGQVDALFPDRCKCGGDHRHYAWNLRRAWKQILPGARPAAEHLNTAQIIALAAIKRDTDEATELQQKTIAATLGTGVSRFRSTRSRRKRVGQGGALAASGAPSLT